MEVVINCRHGGFRTSSALKTKYFALTGQQFNDHAYDEEAVKARTDPVLIELVKEMGEQANGAYANLVIIEVPDDVEWQVEEYDGYEHIAEKHRTWP